MYENNMTSQLMQKFGSSTDSTTDFKPSTGLRACTCNLVCRCAAGPSSRLAPGSLPAVSGISLPLLLKAYLAWLHRHSL
jgi:hypothetical protein